MKTIVAGLLDRTTFAPVVDVEFPNGRSETGMTSRDCVDWVSKAYHACRDELHTTPMIYISERIVRDELENRRLPDLVECPLWLARYPFPAGPAVFDTKDIADPPVPTGTWFDAKNFWIHQYQGDATMVPGFSSTVDMNRFHLLKRGETGFRVGWVQQKLGIAVTNSYDDSTIAAVKKLQALNNLDVDGIVGAATFAVLSWR